MIKYIKGFIKKNYSKTIYLGGTKYKLIVGLNENMDSFVEEVVNFVEKELQEISKKKSVENELLYYNGIPLYVEVDSSEIEIYSLMIDLAVAEDDLVSEKGLLPLQIYNSEKAKLMKSLGLIEPFEKVDFYKEIRIHKNFIKDISVGKSFYVKSKKGRTNNFEEVNRYIVPTDWDYDINDLIPITLEILFLYLKEATYLLELPKAYYATINTSSQCKEEEKITIHKDEVNAVKSFKIYDEL